MDPERRSWIFAALRWTGSALVVLAVYGCVGWLVLSRAAPVVDQGGGEPAVEIDLEPAPAATPEPPSQSAPGPMQTQPESQAQEAAPQPVAQPVETEPDTKPPPPRQADAQLPAPEKPLVEQQAAPPPQVAAPAPTAPESVDAPQGEPVPSTPGQTEKPPSRAVLTWQRMLVGRLERAKRYPVQAESRQGATTVSFSIDRSGRLLASHIVRSSGSSVFDDATLALLSRSQPFPTPPRDLGDDRLSFEVTIRYAR